MMARPSHLRLQPVRPQDVPAPHPVLLLKHDPKTGRVAWKRTNGRWQGWFDTETAAIDDAVRCGLPETYTKQWVDSEIEDE